MQDWKFLWRNREQEAFQADGSSTDWAQRNPANSSKDYSYQKFTCIGASCTQAIL